MSNQKAQTISEIVNSNSSIQTYYWSNMIGNIVNYKTGDHNPNAIINFGSNQQEWNQTILMPLSELMHVINKQTMLTPNILLVPRKHIETFKTLMSFVTPSIKEKPILIEGAEFVGILSGRLSVFEIDDNTELEENVLVGVYNQEGIKYSVEAQQAAFNKIPAVYTIKDPSLVNKINDYCLLKILNK